MEVISFWNLYANTYLSIFTKCFCRTKNEMIAFEFTEELLTQEETTCCVVVILGECLRHPKKKDLERQF